MSSSVAHCTVKDCKTTFLNKGPGITFHSCPQSNEMRNKWLQALRNKCSILDWSKSKICSKHFLHKCFDSQRKLKQDAVPTLFFKSSIHSLGDTLSTQNSNKSRVDRLLNKMVQSELKADIRESFTKIKEPEKFEQYIPDNLQCKPEAPEKIQMWLLIKKQEHLNSRLTELVVQNKKHTEVLQKSLEETKSSKKEIEQSVETYKYVVKCLQEKLATLEEQVEILTAVESK